MAKHALLQRLFGSAPPGKPAAASEPEDRRRPAVRCSGCKAWASELVYLTNGGHYCHPCAQIVHAWSRARPAGRRTDDVTVLPEGMPTRPDQ